MTTGIVLVSGLPATGKTTVSDRLAPGLHTVALSRDWSREDVVGMSRPPWHRGYDAMVRRVVRGHPALVQRKATAVLLQMARRHVVFDHPVVVQVVADPRLRWALRQITTDGIRHLVELECVCSDQHEWERRLACRYPNWRAMTARLERWYQGPGPHVLRIDSSTLTPSEMVNSAVAAIE